MMHFNAFFQHNFKLGCKNVHLWFIWGSNLHEVEDEQQRSDNNK